MKRHLGLSAALLLTGLVASCGLKGGLERPAPMWGEKAKQQYEEQKAAEAAAKKAKKSRTSVSVPVTATSTTATGSNIAITPQHEDMTVTKDKSDNVDANAPSADDPYDGKGAPPPVEDTTSPQSRTQF